MDLRRGALGAHQLGMRQQAPTNVGKLRRWSASFLTLTRWSRDGTNFVRLTGQLVRPSASPKCVLLAISRLDHQFGTHTVWIGLPRSSRGV
jgi:hypothetical protein